LCGSYPLTHAPGVTTVEPPRTFWDKIVIVHGLRRWHEKRGELRQEGQRVSRRYYDIHCLVHSQAGLGLRDQALGADCVRHARMFFDRSDFDLASAKPGTFAIKPNPNMLDSLRRDYANTIPMIFGAAKTFEEIMASIDEIDAAANRVP
jgi:hypothetical protein